MEKTVNPSEDDGSQEWKMMGATVVIRPKSEIHKGLSEPDPDADPAPPPDPDPASASLLLLGPLLVMLEFATDLEVELLLLLPPLAFTPPTPALARPLLSTATSFW